MDIGVCEDGGEYGGKMGEKWGLEVKSIVDVLEFLGAETKVAAGNHRGAMVENLRKFDECHFAMLACRVDNLTAKGFAEAMAAKVFNVKVIALFDDFEVAVNHLRRDNCSCVVEEAKLIVMEDTEGIIALTDMSLKCAIYLDVAAFSGLLLDD